MVVNMVDESLIIKTYNEGINSVIVLVKSMDAKMTDLNMQIVTFQNGISALKA